MKQIFLLTFFVAISVILNAQDNRIIYQNVVGGNGADGCVAVDVYPNDDYLVCGNTAGQDSTFSRWGYDFPQATWMARFDKDGHRKLYKFFVGKTVSDMKVLSDGGFVICGFSRAQLFADQQVWIARYDATYNLVWEKNYGGGRPDFGRKMLVLPGGGFIVTGDTYSNDGNVSGFHSGTNYSTCQCQTDIWVMKLDDSGNISWNNCYGGTGTENINGLSLMPDGNIIIAATTQSADGDVTGFNGNYNAWVFKLNSNNGAFLFNKVINDGTYTNSTCIYPIDNTNFWLGITNSYGASGALTCNGGSLIKMNTSGTYLKQLCGSYGNVIYNKIIAGTNNELLALGYISYGNFFAPSDPRTNIFINRISNSDNLISHYEYGAPYSDDDVSSAALLSDGKIVLAATVSGTGGDIMQTFTPPFQYSQYQDAWIPVLSSRNNFMLGKVFTDLDDNGTFNGNDIPGYYVVKATNGRNTTGAFSYYPFGNFRFAMDTGNYNIALNFNDTNYAIKPPSYSRSFNSYGNNDSITFRIIPRNDVSSSVIALDSVRLGSKTKYRVTFSTNSVIDKDTMFLLVRKNKSQTYSISSPLYDQYPDYISDDSLLWKYPISIYDHKLTRSNDFYLTLQDTVPLLSNVQVCSEVRTKYADSFPNNNNSCTNMRALGQNALVNPSIKVIAPPQIITGASGTYNFVYGFTSATVDSMKATVKAIRQPGVTYKSASPLWSQISGDTLIWNIQKFGKGRNDTIKVTLGYPAANFSVGDSVMLKGILVAGVTDTIALQKTDSAKSLIIDQSAAIQNPYVHIYSNNFPSANKIVSFDIGYTYSSQLDTTKGKIRFIKDPKSDFVSAIPSFTSINGDTLTWNFAHADSLFNSIHVSLHIKDTPAIQLPSMIRFVAMLDFFTQAPNNLGRGDTIIQVINSVCKAPLSGNTTLAAPQGIQWLRTFGGSADDYGISIAAISDTTIVIAGQTDSHDMDLPAGNDSTNVFVAKYKTDGTLLWKKSVGGSKVEEVTSVFKSTDGNIMIFGQTSSTNGIFSANHGGQDIWVAKFDQLGNLLWNKFYGGTSLEYLVGVKQTSDNKYLVLGATDSHNGNVINPYPVVSYNHFPWTFKLNDNGDILWQKAYPDTLFTTLHDIQPTPDKKFIIAGGSYNYNYGNVIRLLKTDSTGAINFRKDISTNDGYSYNYRLLGNQDSSFYFSATLGFYYNEDDAHCLSHHGSSDFWIGKLDKNVNVIWDKYYGGSSYDEQFRSIKTNDGGLLISGNTNSNDGNSSGLHGSSYNGDAWLLKLDNTGNLQWQKTIGGLGEDFASAAIQLANNDYVVTGATDSYNNGDIFNSRGQFDMILFKIGASNVIRGSVYVDNNANHSRDPSEPYYNQGTVESTKGGITSSSDIRDGFYANTTDTGTYITKPHISNPYYTIFPLADTVSFPAYLQADTTNFALVPVQNINDLKISLLPLNAARPGYTAHYKIEYENVGTTTINGGYVEFIKDSRTTFDSSSVIQSSINGDTIRWNLNSLAPIQGGAITLHLKLKTPPQLNLNDTLNYKTTIYPLASDSTPLNNKALVNQLVVGSFDPNDKVETHGPGFTAQQLTNGDYLNYIIRFQNTGTDTAFRVVVRDTLSSKLNSATIEMVSASSAYTLSIKEGKFLEWKFDPIILPDSNHNEAASHGYVAFRIKPITGLQPGDTISNRAAIYFDFNLPVLTNQHNTIIKSEQGICPGSNQVYNSTIAGNNYQWQVNNGNGYTDIANGTNYSGVQTSSLLIKTAPTNWYGYKYRCRVNSELFSDEYTLRFGVQWNGSVSSAWENPQNWNCSVVPDAFTDVIIGTGVVNFPQINTNASCHNLQVKTSAAILIKAGTNLTITGRQN